MEPFKIFLSHCAGNEGPDKAIIKQLNDLLSEAFKLEKVKGTLVIEFDGETPELPGSPLHPGLVRKVETSDLVICCFFPRFLEAHYFKREVLAALNSRKPLIEIRFIPPGEEDPYLYIEHLDPRLEEEVGSGRPRCVLIKIPYTYDDSNLPRVREEIRKHVAGGQLVDAIRKQILERAERDLIMYETAEQVMNDLAEVENRTKLIRLLLYDGGTTIRNLMCHSGFQNLLEKQGENLRVHFLYVDTAFKKYISRTPEYEGSAALQAMEDGAYSAVYEALCRQSGLVHNQSPHGHMYDVLQSQKILQTLKDKYCFHLSIRKTCQLPIYRLIISQHFVYYTHILPHFSELPELGASNYYSLRLSTDSSAGKTLIRHYDSLWKSGAPEPPDA